MNNRINICVFKYSTAEIDDQTKYYVIVRVHFSVSSRQGAKGSECSKSHQRLYGEETEKKCTLSISVYNLFLHKQRPCFRTPVSYQLRTQNLVSCFHEIRLSDWAKK